MTADRRYDDLEAKEVAAELHKLRNDSMVR
jgi:hypothetical protein